MVRRHPPRRQSIRRLPAFAAQARREIEGGNRRTRAAISQRRSGLASVSRRLHTGWLDSPLACRFVPGRHRAGASGRWLLLCQCPDVVASIGLARRPDNRAVRVNFVQANGNQTHPLGIGGETGDREGTQRTTMGSFIHHDLIAEKLEMARTLGLVTDYAIAAVGQARPPEASVRVWRNPNASSEAIKDYLVRLLAGLVAAEHIVMATPFVAGEAVADESAREAPAGGTAAAPVAA